MARTLQPDSLISHYRIIGPLGAGGMGEVYLARDESLDRNVALKVLPPELVRSEDRVRRFILEAKSASSLNHPHIVTIYEVGADQVREAGSGEGPSGEPIHFIAMELVSGRTLKDLIHQDRVDLKTCLGHLAQAAEGLSKAHAAGIVHRDLKPGNIMVTADGYAKVLDFGLAKLTERTSDDVELTSAPTEAGDRTEGGAVVGTVGYMSPEQVRGKGVDHRSDIFSFGCILYEAATRQRAFHADSQIDTMHRILHDEPPPVEGINPEAPAEVRRLIRRCLAKNPDRRFQSVKDLAIDLRECVDGYDDLTLSGTSGTIVSGAVAARRRSLVLTAGVALAVVLGLVAVGLGAWSLLGRRAPAAAPFSTTRLSSLMTHPYLGSAVLSPDGRYLAYMTGPAGRWSLTIRQVATGSDVEVVSPRVEEVRGITFSPDGNYLYFLQRDPETPNYSSLFEVPSLGGTPRKRFFDVDTAVSFAPDGKRISFLRGVPQDRRTDIVIADLAAGSDRALATVREPEQIDLGTSSAWSPDGRTIVVAIRVFGGGIRTWFAGFDSGDGTRTDVPSPSMLVINGFAWMPDGRGLVVTGIANDAFSHQARYLSWPDGALHRITNDLDGWSLPSVTADGTSVAAMKSSGVSGVWRVPADGGSPARPILPASSEGVGALQTAEGGTLVFLANTDRWRRLFTMRPDGSERRALTTGSAHAVDPIVVPGRATVAVDLYDGEHLTGHVYVADLDGGNLRRITDGEGEHLLAVSADGTRVFFRRAGAPDKVFSMPIDGGEEKLFLEGASGAPEFSPDGRFMAYTALKEVEGRQRTVIRIAPAGGGDFVTELLLKAGEQGHHWLPDGSGWILARREGNVSNLWRQPRDGGEAVPITHETEGRMGSSPVSSPDGSLILVTRMIDDLVSLWVVPVAGGELKRLTDPRTGIIQDYAFSPDGKDVFFMHVEPRQEVVLIQDAAAAAP